MKNEEEWFGYDKKYGNFFRSTFRNDSFYDFGNKFITSYFDLQKLHYLKRISLPAFRKDF